MIKEKSFSIDELKQFNGDQMPMYIAYEGIVYDVTNCPKWRTGLHEGLHWPGQDLTYQISNSPHNQGVFKRPCVKRVGILINT